MKKSDRQLLLSYQNGDEDAGNALFQRYRPLLYRFLRRSITGNPSDAEDLVQETFLEALKSIKKGHVPDNFRPWLYSIANRVLARWIKEKYKQDQELPSSTSPEDRSRDTDGIETVAAPARDEPAARVIDDEIGKIRRDFEAKLPSKEQSVFILRNNTDMSFSDIAKRLHITTNSAKVRHHRAVKKFRDWLKKHYPDIYVLVVRKSGNK